MSTTARVMTIDELEAAVGQELGTSSWLEVSQEDVDRFADATQDHQWIHTDPARAASSPFGGTIAHGYYTLALAPVLFAQLLSLDHFPMAVNYGLDKLRFPAPLLVGSKLRMAAAVDGVERFDGGATLRLTLTFESDRGGKPVCIAQVLYRLFEARS
jgi:acyl dehydratase